MIVVTGGTKGIGRAIVEKFMQEGFDVITCARNQQDLERLQEELEAKFANKLYYHVADLSRKEEVEKFGNYAKKLLTDTNQQLDVLVNNTGVFLPGQILQEDEGAFELQIQTNLYSAYYLSRMLVPLMVAQKRGNLFNICSTASITAYPNGGSYCISKFALHGMTKVLREELKPHHVRVTSVLPGATFTASWEGVDLPQERFMQSKDVAEAIFGVFRLSPQTVVEEILLRPQLGDIV